MNREKEIKEAQKEIEKVLGHKIVPQKDIKFNTGRLEKLWTKNVLFELIYVLSLPNTRRPLACNVLDY